MADTLTTIAKKNEYAEVYNDSVTTLGNLTSPTQGDWDSLPQAVKDRYNNSFTEYKAAMDSNNDTTRAAIKTKLLERKVMCQSESAFSSAEQTQYAGEFNTLADTIG